MIYLTEEMKHKRGKVTVPATIRDIARKAGVAPSTVSRVLNNKGRISESTRQRILRIAQELDYHPNMNAKGLATSKTGSIGVIINRRHRPLLSSFYGTVIAGVEEEIEHHEYDLILSTIDNDTTPPRCVRGGRVDGLIIMGCDVSSKLISLLRSNGLPLVLVDNHIEGVDSIATDNINGAHKAVSYLINNLGHKKIGFIAERLDNLSFRERFEGYKMALRDHGLRYDKSLVAEGGIELHDRVASPYYGYIAAQRLLEHVTPTAIFAANDAAAAGAIRAINEKGLNVPRDISVIGFDDGDLAPHTTPPLTTMRVFRTEAGALAARRLLELIKEPEQMPLQIRLPAELIIRESCSVVGEDN